ncbi:hypothetical protein M8J76_008075 [Diaphorina citri]|nr:hypothetical protein M8J75_012197 [Diaphorina citri]KAI5723685.1 hypothetical protein M8J76_009600 [Diaphorina citri]KAI5729931.1 hypothetical protein M8J76_008075 [Diaphorina citri]
MDGQRKNTNTPGTILGPPPEKTVCPSMDTHMRDIPEAAASTSGNPLMTPERLKQRALNPKVAVEMDLSELENFKKFFDSWKFPPEYDCFQKAISELLFGFERVLLEQRASHAQPQKEKPQAVSMYETDEEELDHETNWVEKTKKRKKRNNNGFPGLQTDRNKAPVQPVPKSQVREMSYARVTSQNDCQNKVTASESILQVILNEVKSIKQSMDDRFKEVTRRVNRIENRYNNPAPTSRRS